MSKGLGKLETHKSDRANKSKRNRCGRGEVAWLAYRPVEPGARVQIPAPALKDRATPEAVSKFRTVQPFYRLDQDVFGDPADVWAHSPRGFQDLPVDVLAGRFFVPHFAVCTHMVSCVSRCLMPAKGNAEAAAHAVCPEARWAHAGIHVENPVG